MPANRIDWQAIKGSIVNQDDAVLFVLPDGFRQLVLSTVDSLGWEATYRINNYDYADFDTLQATVAAGVSGLMDGVMLQDIIGYIDELETLLAAIRDKSCCNDGTINYLPADEQNNTGTTIDPDVGDPPTDYGDTPIADWQDWHDYVCEATYWVIEYLAQMLERLADFETLPAALTVEQIKTLLYRIPLFGVLISEAWAVFAGIIQLAWDNIADMQEAADNIRSAADTIACAFVSADGAAAAGAAMKDAVQTAVTGFWASGLVQFLPYEQYANWIYTGAIVDAEGVPHYLADELLPGAHTCCSPVYDFDYLEDFAIDPSWGQNPTSSYSYYSSNYGGSWYIRHATSAGWTWITPQRLVPTCLDTDVVQVVRVTFDLMFVQDVVSAAYVWVDVNGQYNSDCALVQIPQSVDNAAVWQRDIVIDFDCPGLVIGTTGGTELALMIGINNNGGSGRQCYIDNVRVQGYFVDNT